MVFYEQLKCANFPTKSFSNKFSLKLTDRSLLCVYNLAIDVGLK